MNQKDEVYKPSKRPTIALESHFCTTRLEQKPVGIDLTQNDSSFPVKQQEGRYFQ